MNKCVVSKTVPESIVLFFRRCVMNKCVMSKTVVGLIVLLSFGLFATAASANYMTAVTADNPVAYWRLGETTGTFDSSISGAHPGTDYYFESQNNSLTRGEAGPGGGSFPGFGSGNVGISLANDATPTGLVEMVNNDGLQPGTGDFSFETWVYTDLDYDATDRTGYIIDKRDGSRNGYMMSVNPEGKVYLKFSRAYNVSGGDSIGVTSPDKLSLGGWHQLVGVLDRDSSESMNQVLLYIDGELVVDSEGTGIYGDIINPTASLVIGAQGNKTSAGFNGSIDELSIYNFALSSSQVLSHYNAATVPEPASVLMMVSAALFGILVYAWRKRN